MLHRYVAVIATRIGAPMFAAAVRLANETLGAAHQVVDTPFAAVWVMRRAPSRLAHRPLAGGGCLVGLDFNPAAQDPETLLEETWGAYVSIAVDTASGAVTVQRDPTGRVACWRLQLDGVDLLFSHLEDVGPWLEDGATIDWAFVAHQLNQDWLQGEATGFAQITEVLAGEAVLYRFGRATKAMRWAPHRVAETPHPNLEVAERTLREAGERSVAAWARSYDRVSVDLSGGLDSAIVLGLLRGVARHADVVGFNMVTPGSEGDERAYALDAARLHGIDLVDQDVTSESPAFEAADGHRLTRPGPSLIASGYGPLRAAFARERGTEAAFTGIGGDHVFFQNLQVEALRDYLHHGGAWSGVLGVATYLAQLSRNTVWAAFASAAGASRKADDDWGVANPFLTPQARGAADFERYAHPWAVMARGQVPPAKLRQITAFVHLQKLYERTGRADLVDEVHPLMSQPMLETSLRTPAHWFGVGGIQRGLARRAFADLLPQSIRERRSKGGSTVYFTQFAGRRLAQVRALLLEGRLVQQGLLDRASLESALTPMAIAASADIAALLRCLRTELWVRQAEAAPQAQVRPRLSVA